MLTKLFVFVEKSLYDGQLLVNEQYAGQSLSVTAAAAAAADKSNHPIFTAPSLFLIIFISHCKTVFANVRITFS